MAVGDQAEGQVSRRARAHTATGSLALTFDADWLSPDPTNLAHDVWPDFHPRKCRSRQSFSVSLARLPPVLRFATHHRPWSRHGIVGSDGVWRCICRALR
jgi:hypothetical protein